MRARWLRLGQRVAVGVLALLFLVVPARAQEEEKPEFREPGINFKKAEKPYIQWLAGALIIIACLLVAFKNPHRSHLD